MSKKGNPKGDAPEFVGWVAKKLLAPGKKLPAKPANFEKPVAPAAADSLIFSTSILLVQRRLLNSVRCSTTSEFLRKRGFAAGLPFEK